jgi:hypothetical protein
MELVAQLDQINAYLMLMIPLLEADLQQEWKTDLHRLVQILLRDFHDQDNHRFYGYLHSPEGKQWGQRHNDFGHTAKAYWMIERAGRLLGEEAWVEIATAGLQDVLNNALVRRHIDQAPDWQRASVLPIANSEGYYHVWANEPQGIGITWWEWCELDQAAATLALKDERWLDTLEKTLPTFYASMVDGESGAVLSFPGATLGARSHHWFNGYHAAEHALVGAITAAFVADQEVELFFAPAVPEHPVSPYLFAGTETVSRNLDAATTAVTFTR